MNLKSLLGPVWAACPSHMCNTSLASYDNSLVLSRSSIPLRDETYHLGYTPFLLHCLKTTGSDCAQFSQVPLLIEHWGLVFAVQRGSKGAPSPLAESCHQALKARMVREGKHSTYVIARCNDLWSSDCGKSTHRPQQTTTLTEATLCTLPENTNLEIVMLLNDCDGSGLSSSSAFWPWPPGLCF